MCLLTLKSSHNAYGGWISALTHMLVDLGRSRSSASRCGYAAGRDSLSQELERCCSGRFQPVVFFGELDGSQCFQCARHWPVHISLVDCCNVVSLCPYTSHILNLCPRQRQEQQRHRLWRKSLSCSAVWSHATDHEGCFQVRSFFFGAPVSDTDAGSASITRESDSRVDPTHVN